jgi:hypothetical protein
MTKPIVEYATTEYSYIKVGQRAEVLAIGHPGNDIMRSGTKDVITSTVIKYDEETGEFETLNTCYKPATSI